MATLIDTLWLAFAAPLALALGLLGFGRVWARAGWVALLRPAAGAARPGRLGRYELSSKLGQGAMGEVYRAWDTARGGWRAIKLLPPNASPRERERFDKEARFGAALRHPNAVSIFERGEARDGTAYFAMELLEGINLQELVEREGPQPPERVVSILLQLCAALAEAHARGLVHRDIKPENVILTGPNLELVKLIDFGLVERVGEVSEGSAHASVVGTPLYISPEAIVAPETVGARSDLYGLGALGYFLLRGAPVFQGNSVVEVCGHHLHTPPEPLSVALGGSVPPDLERIIMACLAKDAAARPATAAELAQQLATCSGGPARPAAGGEELGTPRASRRGELEVWVGSCMNRSMNRSMNRGMNRSMSPSASAGAPNDRTDERRARPLPAQHPVPACDGLLPALRERAAAPRRRRWTCCPCVTAASAP